MWFRGREDDEIGMKGGGKKPGSRRWRGSPAWMEGAAGVLEAWWRGDLGTQTA
jgi:hypothetical protein